MRARVLAKTDVLAIVDLLRQQGYEVLAPFCGRGRDTYFGTYRFICPILITRLSVLCFPT
jgi:hypothetical protein